MDSHCRNLQAFVDGVNIALDVLERAEVPVHYLDILPAPLHLPVDADEDGWIEVG